MRLVPTLRRVLVVTTVVASVLVFAEPAGTATTPFVAFTQPLRIPPVYSKSNIDVTMREACVPVLPGPCTKMWTYDGVFPGPTIRRPSGKLTRVTFKNDLPKEVGSTTVHHHGNHSESRFDGQPDDHLIGTGEKFTYEYDFMERGEPERAAFQWYHDHRMDVTGRNVWMGLAGMVVLDDAFDKSLPLPKGQYDVPLMVVDRTFDEDNQLVYRFNSGSNHGEQILVNGVPSPYFDVADRAYRFRILNASNSREYRFELGNGQEMVQVASESGLLPAPVHRKSIVLGPAERAELVVDFAGLLGQDVVLTNTNPPVIQPGELAPRPEPSEVMQFRVRRHAADNTRVPHQLRPVPTFGEPALVKRVFSLGVVPGAGALHHQDDAAPQHFLWTINGQTFDKARVDADPKLGATERWVFTNNTNGQHRIHIHDVDWKIVSRTGGIKLLTPGDPDVALGEAGLKETFLIQSHETVEVESTFTDRVGKYVFHCHVLEHEDNGMMAQFEVMGPDISGGAVAEDDANPTDHPSPAAAALADGATRVQANGVHADAPPSVDLHRMATEADHAHALSDGDRGTQTATAVALLVLGVAAAALALQRNRPAFSKLAGGALALQLLGLGWDMAAHASAGERFDLFENGGHLVALSGIVVLAAAVGLPSRFTAPRQSR